MEYIGAAWPWQANEVDLQALHAVIEQF